MEYPAQQAATEMEAISRVRGKCSHFLLRDDQHFSRASQWMGRRMETAGLGARLHHGLIHRWRLGESTSVNQQVFQFANEDT